MLTKMATNQPSGHAQRLAYCQITNNFVRKSIGFLINSLNVKLVFRTNQYWMMADHLPASDAVF